MNSSSPPPRRLLQVITPSHVGGAETLLARMCVRLHERGHEVGIAVNAKTAGRDDVRRTFDLTGIPVHPVGIGGKVNLLATMRLWRLARSCRAEILHSHLSTASWWSGWVDRVGGIPSVGHVHGFTSAQWHRHQRHLVACSAAVRDHLVAQGIPSARVTVLPNPVDPRDITPQRAPELVRAELGISEDAPLIGCFGHMKSEKKGWRDLIAAMPAVRQAVPRAQLICVGEGGLRAEYEAEATALGLNDCVRFLGFRRDVADLMNAIDVMTLPSLREPFGLVYVEAALLGKPAVACNAGGAPEVVADGETGLLVPPHDPTALATALVTLLSDRALAERLGAAGRERALELFSWERFLNGLETVYGRL